MSEKAKGITNTQIADSGGKIVFENSTLCAQLLRDYSGIEALKNIGPEDIEDVTERFVPMFTEQRDADVVKKVHLSTDDIFITLIEHKSGVDYNVVMQVLRYMVYIWEDYENQMEAVHPGVSKTKDFKYPPIFPIVYYEDKPQWTADETLKPRIALNEVFEEYIPNFRYHLISINNFDETDLIKRKDGLSFLILINKIRSANELKDLNLPREYLDELLNGSPKDVLNVIARVGAVILRKHNVPENDIQNLVDQLKERKSMALFDNYVADIDVSAERKTGAEKKVIELVCKKHKRGLSVEQIASETEETIDNVSMICDLIENASIGYDVDKIYDELKNTVKSLV